MLSASTIDVTTQRADTTLDQFIAMSGGHREVSDEEYEKAVNALAHTISQKFYNKKLPSIEEQLKNL